MKNCVISMFFIFCFLLNGYSQTQEAQQLLLDVAKLAELKNILTDLKKGYVIISGGYNTIKNISEGNFNLHETFLNSLLEISPAVKKYKRITDIISAQLKIVSEYKSAFKQFRASKQFTEDEINYLGSVYSNLFKESEKNLDALATVVTANKLQMSDDERLSFIDEIWKDVSDQLSFLRHFNSNTKLLALQRAKQQNDFSVMNGLYNVNQ